jgi:hypothetical protein
MLKRIVMTAVLLIGAPAAVVAKVSLLNIRQPEAAVEETRIDTEHASGVESAVPAGHCRPRDESRTSAAARPDKLPEPPCAASEPPVAQPARAQATESS